MPPTPTTPPPAPPTPLLCIDAVGKDYSATTVLDGVTLALNAGEVLALTGENGAGKSTLSKIVCGLTPATRGGMRLAGQTFAPATRREAEQHGVRMVMQELGLVPTLTVAENLLLGRLPNRAGWLQRDVLHAAARTQLAKIGLESIDPATPVSQLGIGQQQIVEIARNLQDDTRILVLDEPTAMLTPRETTYLFDQIARLTARGVAIVYVSHRLEELRRIADRAAVLRDGRLVDVLPMAGLSEDDLVRRMVGRSVNDLDHRPRRTAGPVVMEVSGIGRGTAVQDVSLSLRAGEVFGVAGLVGSGRTELVRLLFGADRADRGSVTLHGSDSASDSDQKQPLPLDGQAQAATKTVATKIDKGFASPLQAIRAGIGLVTEDRKSQGLLLAQPIRINATLSDLPAVSRGGWLQRALEHRLVQGFVRTLSIRCKDGEQPVGQLSGGNQQKVVFARWLHRPVRVLLLDEPTRGVDVGARAEIYTELDRMADEGRALLMVSSDLRELMAMADRIGVMSAGRLVAVFERGEWSEQSLLAAAFSDMAGRATEPPAVATEPSSSESSSATA
ncbi:sugar ABC transporter ATP-binding protein [Acidovorax sp. Leaf78]|uniref:sugar ABC transporter ATP-binding protein n=1 Tax=Acidovorax sp. Leaf78 TaxID=1736237 RepID=UPI0006F6A866|nr:sugar ABC transporter ATP-binding protein [Acidovorax sp. Leaf78]KQO25255.1 sugar ABC transporter ATP-binding protein [Acidovorax sp. Leaf78]